MTAPPTALLTGATSGIGQWTALGLLRAGFSVFAVARDPARAAATERWLRARHSGPLTMLYADLSSLAAVRALASDFAGRAPSLSLLVNNAGLFSRTRTVTRDGIELTLAVNHVAPFVLTTALLPALKAASAARIVNLGSSASDRATLALDDLNLARSWSQIRAYSQSKLAILMQTLTFAERLSGTGVTANVCHPGVVATRIGAIGGPISLLWALGSPFMLTSEQGAAVTLRLSTDPSLATTSGAFFKRSGIVAPNRLALDPTLRGKLWAATERLAA